MLKLKPHLSVQQIAKKHRLDVSFVQKQLDMGEPIEHEHTKDHSLAMDIALQHLDEIPDYYTRLKKMESDAKKEHKKFRDIKENAISELENGLKKLSNPTYDSIDNLMRGIMKKHNISAKNLHNSFVKVHDKTPDTWIKTMKESHEEQRYCPLCDKREERSQCSYGGKAWDKVSVKDHEYSMVRSELDTLVRAAERIKKKVGKGEGSLEAWVQSKITKAADYIDTAADYIASGEMEEAANPAQQAAIAISMKKKGIKPKSEVDEACWVGYKQEGLKKKGKKMVPNCVPTNEAKALGFEIKKSSGAGALTPDAAKQLGDKAVALQRKKAAEVSLPKIKEEKLVDKILGELQEESKSGDSSLHDWFTKSKSSDGKPGWVQLGGKYAGKSCAKQPGQTAKPKCGSSKMASEMSPEEEDNAVKRKRKEDPNSKRSGKAKNVATEEFVNEDACKEKVKSRYKIWPSAYASGALVKCRKVGSANWGNKSKTKNENVTIEDANGNTFAEVVDLIKPDPIKGFKSQIEEATRLQSETGNILAVILSWRGKTYSIRMFFPQVKVPSKKDVTAEIQKVYPGAIVLQFNISTLQAGMPLIQVVNSRSKNYLLNNKTIGEEVELDEEGPVLSVGRGEKLPVSKGAGLTAKGRKRYNSETGSHLQAPVTGDVKPGSKAAQRRKNFCSRSRSWDGERGLAARRRWKC